MNYPIWEQEYFPKEIKLSFLDKLVLKLKNKEPKTSYKKVYSAIMEM
jgi:hypothetical protein